MSAHAAIFLYHGKFLRLISTAGHGMWQGKIGIVYILPIRPRRSRTPVESCFLYPADSWRAVRNTSLAWSRTWDPSGNSADVNCLANENVCLHVAWRGMKIDSKPELVTKNWIHVEFVACDGSQFWWKASVTSTGLHPPPGCVRESSYLVSWKIQRLSLQVPNAEDVHGLYLAALANLTCFDTFSQPATASELMLKWIKMEMVMRFI
jgi:hypothetical protein